MKVKKFDIFLADLDPVFGTEPGKIRPVIIIQTDLLNEFHPSVIICPVTTKIVKKSEILRVSIPKNEQSGLKENSEILVDQIRSIDQKRLIKKIGELPSESQKKILHNLHILIQE